MTDSRRVFKERSQYGAVELKESYQDYLTRALFIAVILHLAAVGFYNGIGKLVKEERILPPIRVIVDFPPSVFPAHPAPPADVSAESIKRDKGTPVPIPDISADPNQTILSQDDLRRETQPTGAEGDGAVVVDRPNSDELPPLEWVKTEKEPVVVKKVDPKYPEIALRAGLEGNVYLKVWVDKEGKVRKAVILKSDAEIFNQAASEAALQWVFTPAIMQKAPVSVWVSIPFRFRLTGK